MSAGALREGECNFGDQLDPLDLMAFWIEKIGDLFEIYPFTLSYEKEIVIRDTS